MIGFRKTRQDDGDRAAQARLDEAEASAAELPHRRKYLLIAVEFLRRLLELHLDYVDQVERELAPASGQRRRARAT